ncbi:MAG: hypothetical protein E6Q97_13340 [Desulfurellales bacterium]|nr:MAG: hypothetical protein E6Q97_13340 [Desulfurellales bacterium]
MQLFGATFDMVKRQTGLKSLSADSRQSQADVEAWITQHAHVLCDHLLGRGIDPDSILVGTSGYSKAQRFVVLGASIDTGNAYSPTSRLPAIDTWERQYEAILSGPSKDFGTARPTPGPGTTSIGVSSTTQPPISLVGSRSGGQC